MAATFSVKNAGVWKAPTAIHVKNAGIWKPATEAYIRNAGVWQKYWPVGPTSMLVSSYTPGAIQAAVGAGEYGYVFRPSANRTVTWMGLKIATGNTGTHKVKLYRVSDVALLATGTFDMTAPPLVINTFVWVAIPSVTLTSGVDYALLKADGITTQQWWGSGPTVLNNATNVAASYNPGGFILQQTPDQQYVGLDLGW